jgi:CelD/BcsL family acetyltransferase involved in cellulose biosynthesis
MTTPAAGNRWRIVPAANLSRFAGTWDAVAQAGGYPPFLRTDFLAPCLREFGSGKEVLAIQGDEGAPAALALLVCKWPAVWETFQPSQLPLGAFVRRDAAPIDRALEHLLPALPGAAAMVAVTQQDPMMVPRPDDSPLLRTLDYVDTARIAVAGSFDDYWSARGKNLRHNVKRQRAKLAESGVQMRVDVVDKPEHVAAAVAEYGRMESAGWKAEGGTAIAPDNAQGRFFTRMLEAFCAAGGGRVYRCLFDDKVVAVDLCIERDGMLVVLKTTYDEAQKAVSPASLLRHEYFRQIFERGSVKGLEFYGKVMEWHLRWTDDVRMLYHVNCYRSSWLKSAHGLLQRKGARERAAPLR